MIQNTLRLALLLLALSLLLGCSNEPADPAPTEEAPAPTETAEPSADGVGGEDSTNAATSIVLNLDEQGRAARGYDVVAYHENNLAVAGDPTHSHTWQDAVWLFSNAENRDAFAADPERYAPSNGGYCTFGVVLKKKLDVDPEIFLVENESLYLFLNPEVQERFLDDKAGNLELVTAHWPEIEQRSPEELASQDS